MTDKQLLEQALEALELANYKVADYCNGYTIEEVDDAITAIKQALAAPMQEPSEWQKIECPICGDMAIAKDIPAASVHQCMEHGECFGGKCIYTTPPAAAVQEPVWCNHCNGSGRMVRDPDIGTDQECFVCNGAGVPAAPVQEPVALQMDVIVGNLIREGINKHRARELAEHFIKHITPPAQRQWVTFPTMLRKMWSGGEVQAWLDENVNKEKNQ